MAEKKVTTTTKTTTVKTTTVKDTTGSYSIFSKDNYMLMLAGIVVMAIGLFLMKGGKSAPNEFNADEVYSTTRITIAPILILLGFVIEIYAIFKKPKV